MISGLKLIGKSLIGLLIWLWLNTVIRGWQWLDITLLNVDWNRYNLTGTDQDDSDGDTLTDLEEYWADTVPTNGASFFGKVSVNDTSGTAGTVMVKIAAPTTNSRIYGLSWATNLVSGSWSNLSGSLPGQNDGSDLIFIVTNAPESEVFYRGRVGLPQVP